MCPRLCSGIPFRTLCGAASDPKILTRPQIAATVDAMLADLAAGKLRVIVDRLFPLAAAAKAHDHAGRGKPFGRVILHP